MNKKIPSAWLPFGAVACLTACTPLSLHGEETVGQRFRRVLAQIDVGCRQMKSGPYLDKSDPDYQRKVGDTSCDILKLEPRDWRSEKTVATEGQEYPVPLRWLATPEGRFAHSIRLPASARRHIDAYQADMTGLEYFHALCKAEGGEFVFEHAQNVDGIRIDRPQSHYPIGYGDLVFYTFEWSLISATRPERFVQSSTAYKYVEIRDSYPDGKDPNRFFRLSVQDNGRLTKEPIATPTASFLVTWRGIRRPNDWENGIYGHEIIIAQTTSSPLKILAVKRSFTRYEPGGTRDARDVFPRPCPAHVGKLLGSGESFVLRVVSPLSIR